MGEKETGLRKESMAERISFSRKQSVLLISF